MKSKKQKLQEQLKKLEQQEKEQKQKKKEQEKIKKLQQDIQKRKETLEAQPKQVNPIQHNKPFLKRFKNQITKKFKKRKCVQVNMQLNNGHFDTLIVAENKEGFIYNSKKYLFDHSLKRYNLGSKQYQYTFHEDLTLPVDIDIPSEQIKNNIEDTGISEVEYAINPRFIERFEKSKIAEGILAGQKLAAEFKAIKILVVIAMLASIINLVLFMVKTGMLQQVTGSLGI